MRTAAVATVTIAGYRLAFELFDNERDCNADDILISLIEVFE